MGDPEAIREWLDRTARGASHRQIAEAVGVQNTALSRWVRTGQFPAERVIDIARHYDAGILEGLLAAGHIREGDRLTADSRLSAPSSLPSDREMLAELLRRATVREEREGAPPESGG